MTKTRIIDLHNDIATNVLEATGKDISKKYSLYQGTPRVPGLVAHNNVDLPRMRIGGVKLALTSIFGLDRKSYNELVRIKQTEYNFKKLKNIKFGLEAALEQMTYYQGIFQKKHKEVTQIKSKSDYQNLLRTEKIGLLIHLEGIDYITKDLKLIEVFYELGARSLAMTWRNRNEFGSGNNVHGGLTSAGKKLIHKTKELGMIFDLAHANASTFWDALKVINFPVIVSHSLCYGICKNSRNLTDNQIRAIAKTRGIIGLAAIPDYIGGNRISDYVDHFEYIISLVGDDYVCFGTDFDGLTDPKDRFISGFTGSDRFPKVIKEFVKRGFSKKTIDKICYKNAERIILNTL